MVDEHRHFYSGPERRKFVRLDYITPLAYKICSKETVTMLLQGYTSNISETGILCKINEKVSKEDILWLSFDRGVLDICTEVERKSLIYQNGVIGKVVRIDSKQDKSYTIGLQFITREEKNLTNIYPKVHFMDQEVEHEKR